MAEGGGFEDFLWENQTWAFSNSDNSGGSEEKSSDKLLVLGSNNQTAKGEEAQPLNKKRGRCGVNKNGKGSSEVKEGKGGGESDHEIHIWTERERRKKMRNMFASLHALLPQLPPKADKSTIVDEATNYIKSLQQTLHKLQKQKQEKFYGATSMNYEPSFITIQKLAYDTREAFLADQGSSGNLAITPTNPYSSAPISQYSTNFHTWTSQNVILNVCGNDAQICVCSPKRPGLFSTVCYVLEKYKLEVVSAHISSDHNRSMCMIQAHANGALDQFPEALPVEEIFKQAAGEIVFWVTSC